MTATIQWIYPPNWDGTMSDQYGWRKIGVILTGTAAETGIRKIDISGLKCINGQPVKRTVIDSLKWAVLSTKYVRLYWDRAPEAQIAYLVEQGETNYAPSQGLVDPGDKEIPERTGDIMLTGDGAYTIEIWLRLKDK